jgi:1-piperideine-2-carboxylate/1-pyrroline-2-carboxylate reductase [NAD(P)H]
MKLLTAEETRRLLPYGGMAEALTEVMRDRAAGRAYAPARMSVPLEHGGVLLLMPATDGRLAITKLVTVHTGNSLRQDGLSVVQAEVLVMDASTGKRLAIMDGEVVTGRRTSALSLLAAQRLACAPGGPLLVIGAGTQARYHIEAFVEALGVREVYIYSRTQAHVERLAAYARTLAEGVEASVVADPVQALPIATLIVTATTSTEPVIPGGGAAVRDDAFIAGVGAFTSDMAELPPALIHRSHIYVDTLDGTAAGAGDLLQAQIDWSRVVELQDVLDTDSTTVGPIIFKSVGHALWDLAAARFAFRDLYA